MPESVIIYIKVTVNNLIEGNPIDINKIRMARRQAIMYKNVSEIYAREVKRDVP